MISVIHVLPSLTTGGAESMVRDYCLLLDKDQFDVHVVVMEMRQGNYNEQVLAKNGVRVTYLSELMYAQRNDLNVFEKFVRKLSRYYEWRKIVVTEKPDIIHLHLHIGKYMWVVPRYAIKNKTVLTVHNVIDNFFSKECSKYLKFLEYKEVRRLIHKCNMRVITLHDKLNEELQEYFDTDKVITINNGVVLKRFDKALYDRDSIREKLGLKSDEMLIGNVGSLSPQKNHEFIIQVFTELVNNGENVKLLLVGQGNLKEEIEHLIEKRNLSDRVILLSNRSDIPELMCAMDVFFFPSKWEGFGNVMIEAQSIGLRCVVSEAVPKCTRVSDNVSVCNLSDDIEVWCRAIMDANYPVVSKESDISEYNMENCVKKLEETYRDMLNGQK